MGRKCKSSDFEQLAKDFFNEYAESNNYTHYKIVNMSMDKIYGYYRYVVAFSK